MESENKIEKDYFLRKQNIIEDIFNDYWDNHVIRKRSGKSCNKKNNMNSIWWNKWKWKFANHEHMKNN